jgi:hypothetical protein
MSKAHITADDLAHNIVLSCRIFPTSDLSVRLCPKPLHADRSTPGNEHLTNQ